MIYSLAIDGDGEERAAWKEFLQAEFVEYEYFWLRSVVPLTGRPENIDLKSDSELPAGKSPEDIAIAQLHYTVLKNLRRAFNQRKSAHVDDYVLSVGLSFLVAAQDVVFELLARVQKPGHYDPWLETRAKGRRDSGRDARNEWKDQENYPLQWVRDYRNKLLHGRTPPSIGGQLPKNDYLDHYADWRRAFAQVDLAHFETPTAILDRAWAETLLYFRDSWRKHLL